MSSAAAAREARATVEVACDESGFVGGSLFGGTRAFTHASVHLEPDQAADLTEEVRRRTGAHGHELKSSRLNRPWAQGVAAWLCGADGPLRGRAVVHVTDTRLFGLARLAQVVRADSSPEGWWSAREAPESWEQALRLSAVLAELPPAWERELLLAARDLLWIRRRRRLGPTIEAWAGAVRALADRVPDADRRRFIAGWGSEEALGRARWYVETPPAAPLSEPLLPALRWTVRHWSALGDVDVVHDEQSVLTPARVAAIAAELRASHPGRRLAGLRRVHSRDDPRVQIADLVAGVVRRTVEHRLSGVRGVPELSIDHLVAEDSLLLPTPHQGVGRSETQGSRSGGRP